MPGFPASSKLLQKKWEARQQRMHVLKKRAMRSGVDNTAPVRYPHMVVRLKQIQREEERQAVIDHNNKMLLHKMTEIMRSPGRLDNWNYYHSHSLNRGVRLREQERIALDNVGIAQRLESIRPKYDVKQWADDFEKYQHIQQMWSSSTRDFELTPRGQNKRSKLQASDTEDETGSESSKLPSIETRGSSNENVTKKTPGISRLPAIKSKQEATAEIDAKQLFKAIKGMVKADDVVLKTLIKRSHEQRMLTRDKFEEFYDLNLRVELINSLGESFTALINGLLADRDGSAIAFMQTCIKNNDVTRAVEMLGSRTSQAISNLCKDYRKKYGRDLTEDTKRSVLDEECQTLLLALFKDSRPDSKKVDEDLATKDARELYESGDGRFTSDRGKFMRLLSERGFAHIRTVFTHYKLVTGKQTISDSMREDGCSKEFIEAVDVLGKCLHIDADYWAEQIRKELRPNNPALISILLAHAEKDLVSIRRAYMKNYNIDLAKALVARTGKEAGPLTASIVLAKSPSNKQDKSSTRKVNGITFTKESKKTNQPEPKKGQTPAAAEINKRKTKPSTQPINNTRQNATAKNVTQLTNQNAVEIHARKEKISKTSSFPVVSTHSSPLPSNKTTFSERKSPKLQNSRTPLKSPVPLDSYSVTKSPVQHSINSARKTPMTRDSNTAMKSPIASQDGVLPPSPAPAGSQTKSRVSAHTSTSQTIETNTNAVSSEPSSKLSGDFNPSQAAESVHEAMEAYGQTTRPLITILSTLTRQHRQQLKDTYHMFYDKMLQEQLVSTMGDEARECLEALFLLPGEYGARSIRKAIIAPGGPTRYALLISTLATGSNQEIRDICECYQRNYNRDLGADLENVGGHIGSLFAQLARGERSSDEDLQGELVDADTARLLGQGGRSAIDVSSETFQRVLTVYSARQARLVFERYEAKAGHTIEDGIKAAKIGDTKTVYLQLVAAVTDPAGFFARQLGQILTRDKLDTETVIQMTIPRLEKDLADIKRIYEAKYGSPLQEHVQLRLPKQALLLAILSQ